MIATGFFGGFFGARYARIHCDQEHRKYDFLNFSTFHKITIINFVENS